MQPPAPNTLQLQEPLENIREYVRGIGIGSDLGKKLSHHSDSYNRKLDI